MQRQLQNNMNAITKYQKFKIETIDRSLLKSAPYNPRVIDASAKKKLKEKLKKVGLVETIVWNKLSGNVVSGHQRLAILDDLNGNQDYALTVSVVEVNDKTEKELNVFLNNTNAMGNYDYQLLESLTTEVNYKDLGFDKLDMAFISNDLEISKTIGFNDNHVSAEVEKINAIKQRRKEYQHSQREKDNPEHYIVVVFPTAKETDNFLKKMNLPLDNRYVDGDKFKTLIDIA